MTHPDDCPLGPDGLIRIMVALERIETSVKDMKENEQKSEERLVDAIEKLETKHGKRLEHLEAIEGRHGLIAACISAVIAGIALFGKYIFGGKA